jgi:hypothetical protein
MSKYGPFATIVATALALAAVFSALLLRTLGSVKKWAYLADKPPPFLVTAGPRLLALALMATGYLLINKSNYGWSLAGAVVCACLGAAAIIYFDRQRQLHVLEIPLVAKDGSQLTTDGVPQTTNVIIGDENTMLPAARKALDKACKRGALSLARFMSGYGEGKLNDPEALWDRSLLAKIGSRITIALMSVILFAVLALFLAALSIAAANRAAG